MCWQIPMLVSRGFFLNTKFTCDLQWVEIPNALATRKITCSGRFLLVDLGEFADWCVLLPSSCLNLIIARSSIKTSN